MAFETKDSGQRMSFESGMVRDVDTDKTMYDLPFSGPMFKRWAELLTRGAKKYSRNNWMKAAGEAELERFRSSAVRHFVQWLTGETDEDHAAAVFFNINGAEYVKAKLATGLTEKSKLQRPFGSECKTATMRKNQYYWCSDKVKVCETCDARWDALSEDDKKKELA